MKKWMTAAILCCMMGVGVFAQRNDSAVKNQSLKFQRLLALVDAFYVDTVNLEQLTEDAIVKMLADLDPHSVYISKEEMADMNEPLEGGFFGIGIQFTIYQDTLMVVSVVPGGPSERVGLLAGDRIVTIDDDPVTNIKLTNAQVRKRLKGEKGTIVRVGVLRGAERMDFRIERDKIPLHSVDAAYMIDKSIGYIKISRFSANTVDEFSESVTKLQTAGMKDLILDLQGNVGGYLEAAIGIGDQLLDNREMIVYTNGLATGRREEYATSKGLMKTGRLVLLVDGNSASASEIVAGAVQDWDRGLIVGRRSFGKGLVQRQYPLTDGTMVRLTVAHYYTPSGRCIQKPYKDEDYRAELYNRYETGELLSADSIAIKDTVRYYTKRKHRVVYGGGGIIPDLFVPIDTSVNYTYYNRLNAKNVIGEYVVGYIDKNRTALRRKYPTFEKYRESFEVTADMIDEIVAKGEKAGVPKQEDHLKATLPTFRMSVKALIARDVWDMNEMYQIFNADNRPLQEAVRALRDGEYERRL